MYRYIFLTHALKTAATDTLIFKHKYFTTAIKIFNFPLMTVEKK